MKLTFTVTGMTCAACSARVEKVTRAVPGVQQADVNLLAGYHAFLPGEEKQDPKTDEMAEMKLRIGVSAACLIVLMYFTMRHMVGLSAPHWYHGTQNALVAALLQFF